MSIRDEVWQAFLGSALTHEEMHDQALLCDKLQLQDNDPFWGIIAFFYYQSRQLHIQQRDNHTELTKELKLLQTNTPHSGTTYRHCPPQREEESLSNTDNKKYNTYEFKLEHYLLITLLVLTLVSILITVKHSSVLPFTPSTQNELINWGNSNPLAKKALLNCTFSSQSRIVVQQHHRICYPAGEGIGYYLK